MVNDPLIKDDQAIILSIKDKGLMVMTGCDMQRNKLVWIESTQCNLKYISLLSHSCIAEVWVDDMTAIRNMSVFFIVTFVVILCNIK